MSLPVIQIPAVNLYPIIDILRQDGPCGADRICYILGFTALEWKEYSEYLIARGHIERIGRVYML